MVSAVMSSGREGVEEAGECVVMAEERTACSWAE
jgi:hypothetical protein